MFNIENFIAAAKIDLMKYADARKNSVARGTESPELAALLLQKYGYGLDKAVLIATSLADHPIQTLMSNINKLVAEIDPNWIQNQNIRLAARPAYIEINPSSTI